jgi:hypothetical protein
MKVQGKEVKIAYEIFSLQISEIMPNTRNLYGTTRNGILLDW